MGMYIKDNLRTIKLMVTEFTPTRKVQDMKVLGKMILRMGLEKKLGPIVHSMKEALNRG